MLFKRVPNVTRKKEYVFKSSLYRNSYSQETADEIWKYYTSQTKNQAKN